MGKYKGKKVLIMAGKPIGSEDIVNYLKNNKAYTIVTDNHPIKYSPAKLIADESWNISTADVQAIVEKAKKREIDAVFTGAHEFNIWKTMEVCDNLVLPFYASREQLLKTTVKSIYKQLFKNFQIPVVTEYEIKENFIESNFSQIQYPVLIKPVDGSGGYGISICYNEVELKAGYEKAIFYSKMGEVLVEKHTSSAEVTIFYIIQNGKIMLSAMADRFTGNGEKYTIPLPVLYIFPSTYLDKYISTLNDNVIAAFESMDLKNGMIFIQSFIDNGRFLFYDIGFRLTGTQEYHILDHICGYHPLEMLVDYSLTGKMGEEDISAKVNPYFNNKLAFNITFLAKPCTIGKYKGIWDVERMQGVLKVIKNHQEGTIIPQSAVGTLNQVVLRVLGVSDSFEDMRTLITSVKEEIDVLSDRGKTVLIPSFNLDKL